MATDLREKQKPKIKSDPKLEGKNPKEYFSPHPGFQEWGDKCSAKCILRKIQKTGTSYKMYVFLTKVWQGASLHMAWCIF